MARFAHRSVAELLRADQGVFDLVLLRTVFFDLRGKYLQLFNVLLGFPPSACSARSSARRAPFQKLVK